MTAPIILHKFADTPGDVNLSSFCLKLECWLKLAGLPYRVQEIGDLDAAPKGQAPWITLPDGTAMGDTGLIIPHLERLFGVDPDEWLSPRQRAMGRAVAALCEERIYYAILRFRWMEEAGFSVLKDLYFDDIPEPVRTAVSGQVRDGVRAKLHGHGYGRHRAEEVAALAAADIAALSELLGDSPWLFGDRPGTADCTAWATVANLLSSSFVTPLRAEAARHPNLVAYHRWGMAHWFPQVAQAQAA